MTNSADRQVPAIETKSGLIKKNSKRFKNITQIFRAMNSERKKSLNLV